jgi:hypothetical protein
VNGVPRERESCLSFRWQEAGKLRGCPPGELVRSRLSWAPVSGMEESQQERSTPNKPAPLPQKLWQEGWHPGR